MLNLWGCFVGGGGGAGQETTSIHKPVTTCPENIPEAGYKCLCLNARSIINTKRIHGTTETSHVMNYD